MSRTCLADSSRKWVMLDVGNLRTTCTHIGERGPREVKPMKLAKVLIASFALFGIKGVFAQEQFTYNEHVAQIINDNCVVCHQEGGIGPMQLASYDQIRPWAPLIQLKVANREMPPYAYDHGIGIQDLIGDWRLQQEEIDTIVAWVEQGSPEGDPDLAPPVAQVKRPDQWNFEAEFGAPDLIVPSSSIDIPANGNDLWLKEFVDPGITASLASRCIRAVQVKPRGDAAAVVHHANSILFVEDEYGELRRSGMLTEYAMGKWGEKIPSDVCRTLPDGAQIQWSIHMYPGGVGATARGEMIKDNVVEIGLWFHDEGHGEQEGIYRQNLRQYPMRSGYENGHLIVPPHGYIMTQGFHSFDHPVRIDSFQPHGHLRMNAAWKFSITEQISRDFLSGNLAVTATSTKPTWLHCCRQEQCWSSSSGTTTPPTIPTTRIRTSGFYDEMSQPPLPTWTIKVKSCLPREQPNGIALWPAT